MTEGVSYYLSFILAATVPLSPFHHQQVLTLVCLPLAQLHQCLHNWQLEPISLTIASLGQQGCYISACHLYVPSFCPKLEKLLRISNMKVVIVNITVDITPYKTQVHQDIFSQKIILYHILPNFQTLIQCSIMVHIQIMPYIKWKHLQ